MRTFVLGDIHGGYRALLQCLRRSGFDNERDRLIFLGDAGDGWSQSPECVHELRQVRDLVHILGNHDFWAIGWLSAGVTPPMWLDQGGRATIEAYQRDAWVGEKAEHLEFLRGARLYFQDGAGRLFVHGGIEPGKPLSDQDGETFLWERHLFDTVSGVPGFRQVYIGHTPTIFADTMEPLNHGGDDNIWRLDTGAGWYGKLTIMDVETGEFWQSDVVKDLYPGERGRM